MQFKGKKLVPADGDPHSQRILTVLVLTSAIQRFPGIDPEKSETPNHRILQGITSIAFKRRVSAPVQFVGRAEVERLGDPKHHPPALQQEQVAGLIILSAFAEQIVQSIGRSLPFVLIPSPARAIQVDSVGPEHIHGVEMLVRYLYQLGHTRIGYVCQHERPPWAHERFAGYLYALNNLGLPFEPSNVVNMYGTTLSDRRLMEPIIELTRKGVTAWVCASDGLAAQIYRALRKAGLNVPSDVSITGFDGVEQFMDCPPLTTIAVPWTAMGGGALSAILERIHHPDSTPSHREYLGTFVEGKTTAPPPKRRVRSRAKK